MSKKRRYFRRGKGRRRRDRRLPLATSVALAAQFFIPNPSGRSIVQDVTEQNWEHLIYDLRERFVGIDANGAFQPSWVIGTYTPIIVSGLVGKLLGKYVNPTLSRLPLIGKYLKL